MGEMADYALEQMADYDEDGFCGFDNVMYEEEADCFLYPWPEYRPKKGIDTKVDSFERLISTMKDDKNSGIISRLG